MTIITAFFLIVILVIPKIIFDVIDELLNK
jgi:hypothetical protein